MIFIGGKSYVKHDKKYLISILEKLINDKITLSAAAAKCGYSKKQMRRKLEAYKKEGELSLKHKNTGNKCNWKTSDSIREEVIKEYLNTYNNFNFTHFSECIHTKYGLAKSTIYKILNEAEIRSPCAQKKRRKKNVHPLRPRRFRFGELVQVDATFYDFFDNGEVYSLHGAIDDATGKYVGLWMDKQETLNGYRHILTQMLMKYGICEQWYTDRRTVFVYQSNDKAEEGSEAGVQFKKWCDELGIELLETSVSQAKGKIERSWRTFKERWKNELKIMNITNMDDFNNRVDEIMEKHNNRFGREPTREESAFVPLDMNEDNLKRILSIREYRKSDNGMSFRFHNKRIQLIKDDGSTLIIGSKTVVEFRTTSDGETFGYYNRQYYRIKNVEIVKIEKKKKEKKQAYKPPENHPWRHMKF